MCGGGGSDPPKDNSVELEKMKQKEREEEEKKDKKEKKKEKNKEEKELEEAIAGGTAAINKYFSDRGVDPALYQTEINAIIAESTNAAEDLENPSTAFAGDEQELWDEISDTLTAQANTALDPIFPTNFETTMYADSLDDPYIAAIMAEDRKTSEEYMNNLLARNVITQGGYDAGIADIARQDALAQAKLNDFGQQEIAEGRTTAVDISNAAYGAADMLEPSSQPFDANSFKTQLDTAFNDFLQNLEVNIRGNVSGSLYDTSGLANIAGGAQGALNMPYDPNALAGIISTPEDDAKTAELDRLEGSSGLF